MARALLAWVGLVAACGTTDIDCVDDAIQISTRGMLVKSLSMSGPGCQNAVVSSQAPSPAAPVTVRCDTGFTPYCEYYYIDPGASGECKVHIVLESGAIVDKTTTFEYANDGACSGYYSRDDRSWVLTELAGDAGPE
jgi:hypothetical protein